MLAGAQGRHGVGVVVVVGGRHGDGVDVRAGQEGVEVIGDVRHAGAVGHGAGPCEVPAVEGHHLTVRVCIHAGDVCGFGEGGGPKHGHAYGVCHRDLSSRGHLSGSTPASRMIARATPGYGWCTVPQERQLLANGARFPGSAGAPAGPKVRSKSYLPDGQKGNVRLDPHSW